MDILTQITLGAAVGEVTLGKKLGNKAIGIGALAGLLPDLDIIGNLFLEGAEKLAFHRSYTHSILFAILMGALLAFIFFKQRKKKDISFLEWFKLFFLGLFTHIFLDAFTNYGTQVFLPFSDYRIGFQTISIVDVFYTVPLLLSVLIVMFLRKTSLARRIIGNTFLILTSAYLLFTVGNKFLINSTFEKEFETQNIDYDRYMTNPSLFTNFLWYGIAETDSGYYIGYYSIFDKNKAIELDFYPKNDSLLNGIKQTDAIERLRWFSNDYYILTEHNDKLLFVDIRFGSNGIESNNPAETFVFYFDVFKNELGELTFKEYRPTPKKGDMKKALNGLIARIKGI